MYQRIMLAGLCAKKGYTHAALAPGTTTLQTGTCRLFLLVLAGDASSLVASASACTGAWGARISSVAM